MAYSQYEPLPPQTTTNRQRSRRQADAEKVHKSRPDTIAPKEQVASGDKWSWSEHDESETGVHVQEGEDSDDDTKRKYRNLQKNKCLYDRCGALFETAEQLDRHQLDHHQAQGHPNVPGRKQLVCWWPRCGKDYVSSHYLKQHCETKCRYRNNQDSQRLSKSEKPVLTVTQGNERSAEDTPLTVGKAPKSSHQSKRKSSASKSIRGTKKNQKRRQRSPSPEPFSFPGYSFGGRPSSPDEDQFVSSRRPSAASIFPSDDEVGPTSLSLAYLADMDQSSQTDRPPAATPRAHSQVPVAVGNHAFSSLPLPHDQVNHSFTALDPSIPGHLDHGPTLPALGSQSMYYAVPNPHSFPAFSNSPSVSAQGDLSGVTVPGPIAFHLDPPQGNAHISQAPDLSRPDRGQPVAPGHYDIPLAVPPEQPEQPTFRRIIDERTSVRLDAPQHSRYRTHGIAGFSQNCQVFDLPVWTPEPPPGPDSGSHWSHQPSTTYGGAAYYPGPYTE
ncbi:hypothetical protein V8F20_007455 [Naviculisporaceae sp. PSN 640]